MTVSNSNRDEKGMVRPMAKAVLGLGGNLGEREQNIYGAIDALGRLPGTAVLKISSLYQTPPFQVFDRQPDYLNCCVFIETELSPHALVGACLGIEAGMGRVRLVEKGARVIDLDLLLYEGRTENSAELALPHPRMLERAFVLVPLAELFPEGDALGLRFADALADVDTNGIQRMSSEVPITLPQSTEKLF